MEKTNKQNPKHKQTLPASLKENDFKSPNRLRDEPLSTMFKVTWGACHKVSANLDL